VAEQLVSVSSEVAKDDGLRGGRPRKVPINDWGAVLQFSLILLNSLLYLLQAKELEGG